MEKNQMIEVVQKQLSLDMNCCLSDLKKDGITFCEARIKEGRRMFNRQDPFLEVVTMGNSIVVSADKDILKKSGTFSRIKI